MRKIEQNEVRLNLTRSNRGVESNTGTMFELKTFALTTEETAKLIDNAECADAREEAFNALMITKENFEALGHNVEETFDYYLLPGELMTIILLDMTVNNNEEELLAVWIA